MRFRFPAVLFLAALIFNSQLAFGQTGSIGDLSKGSVTPPLSGGVPNFLSTTNSYIGYYPTMYGAKCDWNPITLTGTDDTAAFNALSTAISNNSVSGGEIVQPPGQTCLINSGNLTLNRHVKLRGTGEPFINQGGLAQTFVPFIALSANYTIRCGAAASIENSLIWRADLATKPANIEAVATYINTTIQDSSVAITVTSNECSIKHNQIVGFNKGVYSSVASPTFIDELLCDTANCVEITGSFNGDVITRVRGYPWWSIQFGRAIMMVSGTVVGGGTGYTNGDVLTVSGGTCTTPYTFTATVSGGNVTALTPLDTGNCSVNPQTFGVTAATLNQGGTGGSTGAAQTETIYDPACTTSPTISANISGGAMTAINSITNAGVCPASQQPLSISSVSGNSLANGYVNVTMGKNALALTGGSGSGATATIATESAGYRPGTCLYVHDQADGLQADNVLCEHSLTGVLISNVWNAHFSNIGNEGGYEPDQAFVGVETLNCASHIELRNVVVGQNRKNLYLNHSSSANGGSCGGAPSLDSDVTVDGGYISGWVGLSDSGVEMGAYSTGIIRNLWLAWQGLGWPALKLDANAGAWNIDNIQFMAGAYQAVGAIPTYQAQWLSVDPTATAPTSTQFATPGPGSMVINGDFQLDQFNEGASNQNQLRADRWRHEAGISGETIPTVRGTATGPNAQTNSLNFTNGAAIASITASQKAGIVTQIEGSPLLASLWGTVNASPLALDWCAQSNQTGTFSLSLQNTSQTFSYVIPYSLPVANAWTCFRRVITGAPASTAGAWTFGPAAIGLRIRFDYGSGSNFYASSGNTWISGLYTTLSGNVAPVNTLNATLNIASVHLRLGAFDTPNYTPRALGQELLLAQRFFWKSLNQATAVGQNKGAVGAITMYATGSTGSAGVQVQFPAAMIATPTVTFGSTGAASANCRDATSAADIGAASAVNTGEMGFFASCLQTSGSPTAGDTLAVQAWADAGL